ncbi:hypothetical protein L3V16_08540 [Brucella ciceri]|uniref:hypothetical protein n=1 Tax=Brucella ciceri TaxID=391287 RepID=UPI001F132F90|nr:hypothetical protein [Brucella ciceri]MCH6203890.1 hypothetical protein [Brucella ciceri]
MSKVFDKTGREIMVGDVLKVYHFTEARRRKKHFMYKQVTCKEAFRDGRPIFKVSHLDLSDDYYTIVCNEAHLTDCEIVQSIDCAFESRKRHPHPSGGDRHGE